MAGHQWTAFEKGSLDMLSNHQHCFEEEELIQKYYYINYLKAGFMKARIMPEIITINISEDCPIPVCTMPGHSWGEIVHKYDVTWLAAYKDNTVVKSHKYFFLAATSKFKSQNDMKKYEKARLLQESIESIRKNYQKKMNSSDEKDRQLAVATYLIDKLALRVGNEKGEDEADTVGK